MKSLQINNFTLHLPMPVYPVFEDVGWWRGEDGSDRGEPFRNGFPRDHLLADYEALGYLAEKLGIKLLLGLVLGEWDTINLLRTVPGATWKGKNWNNSKNVSGELFRAREYLQEHCSWFDIAIHGLCHEFWQDGQMERTEFHDPAGNMRPEPIIRDHLKAYMRILEEHLACFQPHVYIPPALNHSLGKSKSETSMQEVLAEFGVKHVITCFDRARQFQPPKHPNLTWEDGIGLIERRLSPVGWQEHSCPAHWDFGGPILPLHWGNVIHPNPEKNIEIINGWADLLLEGCSRPERTLARSIEQCWLQLAVWTYGSFLNDGRTPVLDLSGIPDDIPHLQGKVVLKWEYSPKDTFVAPGCRFWKDGSWLEAQVLDTSQTAATICFPFSPGNKRISLDFPSSPHNLKV